MRESSKHFQKLCQVNANLRELEAWSRSQERFGHAAGDLEIISVRGTSTSSVAKSVGDGPDRRAGCPTLSLFHHKMEAFDDLKNSLLLAFATPIKTGRVLLKNCLRMRNRSQWAEVFALLDGAEFNKSKDIAPQGNFTRELRNKGR